MRRTYTRTKGDYDFDAIYKENNIIDLTKMTESIIPIMETCSDLDVEDWDYWSNACHELSLAYCDEIKLSKKKLTITFLDDIKDILEELKSKEDIYKRLSKFGLEVFSFLEKNGIVDPKIHKLALTFLSGEPITMN